MFFSIRQYTVYGRTTKCFEKTEIPGPRNAFRAGLEKSSWVIRNPSNNIARKKIFEKKCSKFPVESRQKKIAGKGSTN